MRLKANNRNPGFWKSMCMFAEGPEAICGRFCYLLESEESMREIHWIAVKSEEHHDSKTSTGWFCSCFWYWNCSCWHSKIHLGWDPYLKLFSGFSHIFQTFQKEIIFNWHLSILMQTGPLKVKSPSGGFTSLLCYLHLNPLLDWKFRTLNSPSFCNFRFVTPDQKYVADNTPHTPTPFKNALEKYGPLRTLVCMWLSH